VNRNQHVRYGVKILEPFADPGFQQSPTSQVRRIKAAPTRLTGKPPEVPIYDLDFVANLTENTTVKKILKIV